jgi:DNA polymerase III beta subunit
VGNIVQAMVAYAKGELGEPQVDLRDVDRLIAIGSDRMMNAVRLARHSVLQPFLKPEHCAIGSINSPMQCMMKEICAQCLQRHVDPRTGTERFVFSCFVLRVPVFGDLIAKLAFSRFAHFFAVMFQSGVPIRLDADALVRGLRATLFASSADEAKQLLTGVHLRLDGNGLECAATDGHRLAVLRLSHQLAGEAPKASSQESTNVDGEPFAVTVPARSLRELERLLSGRPSAEPLSLFCERGQVVVLWADQVLTSRSLDGTYPGYQQLIPEAFNRRISLDRRAFVAALERVAVLADQHNNVVKLSSDPATGKVEVRADAQDVGRGSESLAATLEGEAIEIAFNVRYLLDGLKAMAAEQVVLQCNAPTTPAVLVPFGDESAFTYLVMPVQIRS